MVCHLQSLNEINFFLFTYLDFYAKICLAGQNFLMNAGDIRTEKNMLG
jgi:hypothetical protein